ncbi:IS3 family transposase [Dactylosporangium aurantiacum]|uniref:IS3 family transposase n=1 Tax=Dactylosporangium aurantiacum TaxID=35754 RepID=A0A9Q9MGX3_9ACTN|nr:IS3 family transposase [Dactylosporangium aurantiacum]MDG6107623.1 IS3 family transposase [Dactylosporangium aurantiacum]UWZ58778.1 IS3 family transposase [Dactylosporangium aurantiacum]
MTFIDEHSDRFAVALLLRVLQISTSTYYAWRKRFADPCDRDLVDLGLLSNIYDIWTASGCTYGADRVHRQLRRDGIRVGRKRVERLMAGQGWQGAFLRRGWRGGSTVQDPKATPAPDLVNRHFTATAPDRLWVADATRIRCGDGVFWLAAVRDAFSNRIVGWKAGDRCDTDLILGALEYGIWSRDVRDQQLVHHSDRGSNTSKAFAAACTAAGVRQSMSAVGSSADNAAAESFNASLKRETLQGRRAYTDEHDARLTTFRWLHRYNTVRRHSRLGHRSPIAYEAATRPTTATLPQAA